MYKAKVKIKFIVDYLQNKPLPSVVEEISGLPATKYSQADVYNKLWIEKTWRDENGYFVPAKQLQGSLNQGLCNPIPIKSNRIKMTKAKAKGTVFVQNNGYIHNGKKDIEPEKDVDVMPGDMNKLICNVRPKFKAGCEAEFEIFVAHDWLSVEALKQGLEQAGQSFGLGSHRPLYGRFIVEEIEKI